MGPRDLKAPRPDRGGKQSEAWSAPCSLAHTGNASTDLAGGRRCESYTLDSCRTDAVCLLVATGDGHRATTTLGCLSTTLSRTSSFTESREETTNSRLRHTTGPAQLIRGARRTRGVHRRAGRGHSLNGRPQLPGDNRSPDRL